MLKGLAGREYLTQSSPASEARLGRGWEELLEHTTQGDKLPCWWDVRYSLGAQPKAASGGGLKLPAISPSFFRQLLIFFSVLESLRLREFREFREFSVQSCDSCQLEMEGSEEAWSSST